MNKTILIILFLLLFNNAIEKNFFGFGYIDEIYIFLGGIYIVLLHIFSNKKIFLSQNEIKILCLTVMFLIVGFIGNIISEYQQNIFAIISSIATIKFILSYFITKILFYNFSLDLYAQKNIKILKFILIITLAVGGIVTIFSEKTFYEENYGKSSLVMFFSHPTYLNAFCVSLITLFTYYLNKDRKNIFYIIVLLILMALTLKAKALMFIPIYLLLMVYYFLKSKSVHLYHLANAIIIFFALPVGLIVFKFFYEKFYRFTVVYANTARNILLQQSFKIAYLKFPLGFGFGTFGSAASGQKYSQAYYDLGISNIYGLTPQRPAFVSDNFWPMILGENGFLGFFILLLILWYFIKEIKKYRRFNEQYFSLLVPIIYLFISSTGESSFANQYSVSIFFIIALIRNTFQKNYEYK